MNSRFFLVRRLIIIYLLSLGVALCLLTASYALPTAVIEQNVKASAKLLNKEGKYPYLIAGYEGSRLDNWTDGRMLTLVIAHPYKSLLKNALLSPSVQIEGKNSIETLKLYFLNKDKAEVVINSYGRYWHGYLIPLRLLLLFFDLQEIRMINTGVHLSLIMILLLSMYKKGFLRYIPAFTVMYVALFPPALMLSMQFSSIFYISIISAIVLLHSGEGKEDIIIFVTGMATSFFDFLTYPIVAICLPLYILMIKRHIRVKTGIKLIFVWTAGYAGLWCAKWVISSILTENNVLMDAFKAIIFRTGNKYNELTINHANVALKNLSILFKNAFVRVSIAGMCVLCALRCLCLIFNRQSVLNRVVKKEYGVGIIICIMPVLWYVLTANHSHIHFWFAFRTGSPILLILISYMVDFCFISGEKDEARFSEKSTKNNNYNPLRRSADG